MKTVKILAILITIVSAVSVVTVVAATPPSDTPETVELQAKMGNVQFPHAFHQKQYDCQICHHTESYENCGNCHGLKPEAPKLKEAFHALCKDCHTKEARGPSKCKECHIK